MPYRSIVPQQGVSRVYMANNHHMLAYASMMQGENLKATTTIERMLASVPDEFIERPAGVVDGFFALPYELTCVSAARTTSCRASRAGRIPDFGRCAHYARAWPTPPREKSSGEGRRAGSFWPPTRRSRSSRISKNPSSGYWCRQENARGRNPVSQGKIDGSRRVTSRTARREDHCGTSSHPPRFNECTTALGTALMSPVATARRNRSIATTSCAYPETARSLFGSQHPREQEQASRSSDRHDAFDKVWTHTDVKIASSCFACSRDHVTGHDEKTRRATNVS